MANIKSAKKRARQSEVRRRRNRSVRTELRGRLKKARVAIEAGSEDAATKSKDASSSIDRAARKGVVHPNTAARLKSRLARKAVAAASPASE